MSLKIEPSPFHAKNSVRELKQSVRSFNQKVAYPLLYFGLCRVKEWQVTLGVALAVSAVSSFVPV